jgi:hypothetical protein
VWAHQIQKPRIARLSCFWQLRFGRVFFFQNIGLSGAEATAHYLGATKWLGDEYWKRMEGIAKAPHGTGPGRRSE